MKKMNTRNIASGAMIAALYTALCLVLSPLSYGIVQVRAAEALTLLPVFSPAAIFGVSVGCVLSNLIGFFLGFNMLGILDVFFGTAATLLAAILSWKLRGIKIGSFPVASALPPVICNALIIGLELTILEVGSFVPTVFAMNALSVGIGQSIACFGLGLPLVWLLSRTGAAARCFPAS